MAFKHFAKDERLIFISLIAFILDFISIYKDIYISNFPLMCPCTKIPCQYMVSVISETRDILKVIANNPQSSQFEE